MHKTTFLNKAFTVKKGVYLIDYVLRPSDEVCVVQLYPVVVKGRQGRPATDYEDKICGTGHRHRNLAHPSGPTYNKLNTIKIALDQEDT